MATEDELYGMTDEELEAAFREAKMAGSEEETVDEAVEEVIEEEAEELEYPDEQDSDDDASSDDEVTDETEDESETEDGEPDEEPEAEDDQTEAEEEETEEEEQPVQEEMLSFKANGQEYKFTIDEMKAQFGKVFGQAMDYTKKMQAIKPHRKTLDAIEQAGLQHEDINLMIDVLKGDKDAIANVLKRTGVDALDLDTENSNYVAKDYGRNDTELAIKDIVDEISSDKEYAVTHNILEKQWDSNSVNEFIKDPNMIKLLHTDVKSGMYDIVNPIAQKLKVFDGGSKSDLDYYKLAAQQYFESQAQEDARRQAMAERQAAEAAKEAARIAEVKAKQAKQTAVQRESTKRKAAAPTRKAAGTKKGIDYLDDSDEAFEEWYKNLQDQR